MAGARGALVVGLIVIATSTTDRDGVATMVVKVKESLNFARETSDIVVPGVVCVVGTVSAVFWAIITPVVSAVVIGTIVTDGSLLARAAGGVEEASLVTGGTGDVVHESVSFIVLAVRTMDWAKEASVLSVVEIGSSSADCFQVAELLNNVEPSDGCAGRANDAGARDTAFAAVLRAAGTGVV